MNKPILTVSSLCLLISGFFANHNNTNIKVESGTDAIWPTIKNPVPYNEELESKVTALLNEMTLEQKVAQCCAWS